MFALDQGVTGILARDLVSLSPLTVATSILAHGISAGSADPHPQWKA